KLLVTDKLRSYGSAFRQLQRSEEHTSELQSLTNLVCRLLLEKKKKIKYTRERDTDENYETARREDNKHNNRAPATIIETHNNARDKYYYHPVLRICAVSSVNT